MVFKYKWLIYATTMLQLNLSKLKNDEIAEIADFRDSLLGVT